MKTVNDPRHNARKVALGSLFCWLFSEPDQDRCVNLAHELLNIKKEESDQALIIGIVEGIKKNRKEIDDIIMECAPEWPIDKIAKIDLIILRIAVYELIFGKETPDKVSIDEAVELAKEFGGDTASKFVNGVLGTVVEIKKELKEKKESKNE
jgi:transcription antitermination protein NusB